MEHLGVAQAALEVLVEQCGDVIVRFDPARRITFISNSVRAYGYEPEDLLGLEGGVLVHPEDRERAVASLAAVLAGGSPGPLADRQNRYRTKSGEWIWLEGNPRAIRDAGGAITGVVNVLRDITEHRLETSLFETAFRSAALGKALVGFDGCFVRTNQAFDRLMGVAETTLVGRSFRDLIHPDDLPAMLQAIARLSSGEAEGLGVDNRCLRPDGSEVWVHSAIALVRGPNGDPLRYVVQVEDLSQRKATEAALRASEAQLRTITENISDVVLMSGLDERVAYASPSVRQTRRRPEDFVGRAPEEVLPPKAAKAVRRAHAKLLAGKPLQSVRLGAPRGDGGTFWMEARMSLLRDPDTQAPSGFISVLRDINHQVAQEEALAEARLQAEQAAAAKSQFLANMSHEIRTPLTAVLGYASLLREDASVQGPAARYAENIVAAGNGLLAIVNDVLDFSKLEAGKFEIRPSAVSVAAVCREIVTIFAAQAQAKGLDLRVEVDAGLPALVELDGDRLRQMLMNLVGNGLKFTEAGAVTVRARQTESPDRILLEVEDTGPGLDEEAQALLFRRFSQVDGSTARRHGGTGLGLAISRGLAEAMGGSISLSSAPGEGACFRVELPAPSAAPAIQTRAAELPTLAGLRLLVVDDNAVNRDLARRVLEAAGAEVTEAPDGRSALDLLARAAVDLVLLDVRMPGFDGPQTLQRLRAEPGPNRTVPVLAFTADAELQGHAAGPAYDGLVRKPIQPAELLGTVAASMRSPRPGRPKGEEAA